MELWILPALLALSIAVCLFAGIWLLLHLQALAALFQGKADIVPASSRPRASNRAVGIALLLFWGGLMGILATELVAIGL